MRVHADQAAFAQLLTNLLPTGDAWPTEPGSVQQQVIKALASTFADLNDRANYLVTDAFPGTAVGLLTEWEASLGLPDACSPPASTIEDRQRAVVAKLIARGGQSVPYFIGVAAALGVAVTIQEFAALRADIGRADDPTVEDPWGHVLQVTFPSTATFSQIATIKCRLRQIKPAQTEVIFVGGPVFILNRSRLNGGDMVA